MDSPRNPPPLPVMVELAPLPRNQVGPFLILGVDKDSDRETIEAGWAQRLIWARRNQVQTPLEDINWAREMLGDSQRRLLADASSLNIDTTSGTLKRLRQELLAQTGCQPVDAEKPLADYVPAIPMPALEELRQAIAVPQLPGDLPAVGVLLAQMVGDPLDPWEKRDEG